MDKERENLLLRKEIVDAYLKVLDRPGDLMQVCGSVTGDSDELRAAVVAAFEVSEVSADAILSLQVRRFTPLAISQMRDEVSAWERRLLEIDQTQGT